MDAVVTWLDTTEKSYIAQGNKDFSEKPFDIYGIGRRDELRFCLRGLFYNMPWLRKYILLLGITNIPPGLMKSREKNYCHQ
jgi:hypothetical protein